MTADGWNRDLNSNKSEGAQWWCPLPALTAYWTNPPTCPRRVICENRLVSGKTSIWDSKKTYIILGLILLAYYFIMDVVLFMNFKTEDLSENANVDKTAMYTPVTHLSVKAILNDHPSQYFIAPSTEYFDMITHFSTTFSFITPNMISFAHLITGFISGKFIASDNLQDRRIGVVLFQFRTWLDAFDGTVHRAQKGLRLQYNSFHDTTGYYIDSTFDGLGGCFLGFGVFFYLLKRFRTGYTQLPVRSKGDADSVNGNTSDGAPYSALYLFWKALSYGIVMALAGKCWDLVVDDYTKVFQTPLKDKSLSLMQFELCHSGNTILIFYLWRLFGGQSMLQYILFIIFIDKIWEFLKYTQYILLCIVVALYCVSILHISHIRQTLGMDV